MAQPQRQADVHQDELCPPNKRYALMDANKKIDLDNPLMYAEAFGVDVPMTQSQPTESTQGTHRTTSAPRSPNPNVDEGESSAPRKIMLEPRSHKESSKVEITDEVQSVNIIEEKEESVEDDYELGRREKRKNVKETRHTPSPTTIRSPRIHSTLIFSDMRTPGELR
ncbi:hypothetical protein Tco_1235348 [Tanacetum coccineum]